MQTQAIEKFSMWARNKLREGVEQRAYDYALDPAAPNAEPKDATTVNGRVLSNEERAMRTELAERIERDGYAHFVEEMAYTWFNRMIAIRFMELHDYLPSHTRVFSSAEDGAEFSPQALSEALTVCIDGLDRDRIGGEQVVADEVGHLVGEVRGVHGPKASPTRPERGAVVIRSCHRPTVSPPGPPDTGR